MQCGSDGHISKYWVDLSSQVCWLPARVIHGSTQCPTAASKEFAQSILRRDGGSCYTGSDAATSETPLQSTSHPGEERRRPAKLNMAKKPNPRGEHASSMPGFRASLPSAGALRALRAGLKFTDSDSGLQEPHNIVPGAKILTVRPLLHCLRRNSTSWHHLHDVSASNLSSEPVACKPGSGPPPRPAATA